MSRLLLLLLACTSLIAADPELPVFGYGSSDAVIPAKDQELFFTGFEAGFESVYGGKIPKGLIKIEHVYNGTQLGAIDGAQRLLKQGVRSLIGFPTSHEALLVAKIASEAKVFALFPAASHSSLANYGPYVYSTGESTETSVVQALKFIKKRFAGKKGLVIYSPFAVYSKDQKDRFVEVSTRTEFKNLELKFADLNQERMLSAEQIQTLKSDGTAYIFITQYASEATAVMSQLQQQGIDLPIITNSSWMTGDIEFVRRYLTLRKAPLYSVGLWLKGGKDSKTFESIVRKRYGVEPTPEIAYGFDLGSVIAQVYKDVRHEKHITSQMIRDAFVKRRCFKQTSSGELCFGPNGGHAERNVQFVRFTKTGFVTVD